MTTPTWELLRGREMMAVERQGLSVGVYPTEFNTVGVAMQRTGDSEMLVFTVGIDDVPMLIRRLQAAADYAREEEEAQQKSAASLMVLAAVKRAKGQP